MREAFHLHLQNFNMMMHAVLFNFNLELRTEYVEILSNFECVTFSIIHHSHSGPLEESVPLLCPLNG
jgi:hypothetical protein